MKRIVVTGVVLLLVLFLLPVLLVDGPEDMQEAAKPGVLPALPSPVQTEQPAQPGEDELTTLRVALEDGTVAEMTMADYLWSVVAAEMPAAFEPEALKAQAVTARTYALWKMAAGDADHPDADVCTDITCCQAYITPEQAAGNWGSAAAVYKQKITSAVNSTNGQVITYEGEPIQAVFFSSAAGKTVDAVEVWGSAVSYLCSVDSPEGEEVPNWRSQAAFSPEEAKALILAQYPGADLSAGPENWFGAPVLAEGGSVSQITVGGVTLTGAQVRSLFSLRSATFTVAYQGGKFVFDVTGYGHGVGMSQYGANAMAKNGSDFREILTWYYTGTEVDVLWA